MSAHAQDSLDYRRAHDFCLGSPSSNNTSFDLIYLSIAALHSFSCRASHEACCANYFSPSLSHLIPPTLFLSLPSLLANSSPYAPSLCPILPPAPCFPSSLFGPPPLLLLLLLHISPSLPPLLLILLPPPLLLLLTRHGGAQRSVHADRKGDVGVASIKGWVITSGWV